MLNNLPLYFGTVININNTFLSHKLPGFHSCGKNSYPIKYFYNQRLIQIPFNVTNQKEKITYQHCHMVLTEEDVSIIKKEFKNGNFLTFHYKDNLKFIPFFIDSENLMYTQYDIELPLDNKSNQFNVKPNKPVLIEPAKFLDINFALKYTNLPDKNPTENILQPLYVLLYFSCLILSIILCSYYIFYFEKHDLISQTEIWKRPRSYSNTVLASSAGVQIICAIIIVCSKIKYSLFTEQLLYNSLLIGSVALSLFRGVVGLIFGDNVQDPELLAPTLFIYSIFMIPHKIINALSNILGSFRGPNLIPSIINDIIFLLFAAFLSRAFSFCFHSMLMHQKKQVPYYRIPTVKSMGSGWMLFSIVVNILCALILLPCSYQIIDSYLINQNRPNYGLIVASILAYFSVIFLLSMMKTISKLKNGTDHWMSSHFHDSFITTIILLVFVIVLLIITESIHTNQAFLFAACYLAGILLSVFCVGVFASLSAALMFVYFTFYKSKI